MSASLVVLLAFGYVGLVFLFCLWAGCAAFLGKRIDEANERELDLNQREITILIYEDELDRRARKLVDVEELDEWWAAS